MLNEWEVQIEEKGMYPALVYCFEY
jgi:hypothetical protein